ncbi:MAG: hypothetical protein ACU837_14390 [Gammaproteobacteria bacterium]
MLIEPTAAANYEQAQQAALAAKITKTETLIPSPGTEEKSPTPYERPTGTAAQTLKKQFYASVDLDPILAKKQFADIVEEVIMQFTSRPGVKIKIAIEIQAESNSGFDEGLQRVVKENCNTLHFRNAEFEEEGYSGVTRQRK